MTWSNECPVRVRQSSLSGPGSLAPQRRPTALIRFFTVAKPACFSLYLHGSCRSCTVIQYIHTLMHIHSVLKSIHPHLDGATIVCHTASSPTYIHTYHQHTYMAGMHMHMWCIGGGVPFNGTWDWTCQFPVVCPPLRRPIPDRSTGREGGALVSQCGGARSSPAASPRTLRLAG